MKKKIDIGVDKNLYVPDPKAAERPQMQFMMEDITKTSEEAVNEARRLTWDRWINSDPLIIAHYDDGNGKTHLFNISEGLEKKVQLIHFWDFSLPQSRRALTYVLEWHRRYENAGLVVIGVHSPFLEVGHDKKLIQDYCKKVELTFPVVLDNQFEIWKAFENRHWPRSILIDHEGKTQLDVTGEERYAETEKTIQGLLRNISPGLPCPMVLKPLRKSDEPDAIPPQTTEEMYVGLRFSPKIGNPQHPSRENEEVTFVDDGLSSFAPELLYFNGPWIFHKESAQGSPIHKTDLKLSVKFTGTDVYILAASKPKNPLDMAQQLRAQVFLNKKASPEEKLGEDVVMNEYRRTVCAIREARMYHVLKKLEYGLNEFTMIFDVSGGDTIEIFGVFFETNQSY